MRGVEAIIGSSALMALFAASSAQGKYAHFAAELEARVPGMEVQRIDEPVFKGHVVVYEAGKHNARGILLVHGIGSEGARDFREHIEWLRKTYHVVAVDLPGFGQSDKANVLYSPENYARVLKHVAGQFLSRPFTLMGHSMGAVVSLCYAAAYPEDVERLVVADAPGVLQLHSFLSHYLASGVLTPLEKFKFDPESLLSSPVLRGCLLFADPVKIAGLAVASEDLREILPKVAAETLVVWGAEDTIAPLRTGRVLALKLPHARLTVIEHAGHVLMREEPEHFRAAIEPFLAHGFPPVEGSAGAQLPRRRDAECHGKRNALFQGEYDKLTLDRCQGAHIHSARVRELRVLDSTVTIDDSRLGGGKIGVYASGATITMTGGQIQGDTAIDALSSRLDLAAVEVEGREAAVVSPKRSYVVFSLSRVLSPRTSGELHGFYAVTAKHPL